MKYEVSPRFDREYGALPDEHKSLVRAAIPVFNEAAERFGPDRDAAWPLRVSPMKGHDRVWEMSWNFRRPDGRATFEWIKVDGEWAIRWRRIGSHAIFGDP